jgi:hypothetical protein
MRFHRARARDFVIIEEDARHGSRRDRALVNSERLALADTTNDKLECA